MVGESGLKTGRRTLKVFLGAQQETLGSLDLNSFQTAEGYSNETSVNAREA